MVCRTCCEINMACVDGLCPTVLTCVDDLCRTCQCENEREREKERERERERGGRAAPPPPKLTYHAAADLLCLQKKTQSLVCSVHGCIGVAGCQARLMRRSLCRNRRSPGMPLGRPGLASLAVGGDPVAAEGAGVSVKTQRSSRPTYSAPLHCQCRPLHTTA